jgi:hypothetical protein
LKYKYDNEDSDAEKVLESLPHYFFYALVAWGIAAVIHYFM